MSWQGRCGDIGKRRPGARHWREVMLPGFRPTQGNRSAASGDKISPRPSWVVIGAANPPSVRRRKGLRGRSRRGRSEASSGRNCVDCSRISTVFPSKGRHIAVAMMPRIEHRDDYLDEAEPASSESRRRQPGPPDRPDLLITSSNVVDGPGPVGSFCSMPRSGHRGSVFARPFRASHYPAHRESELTAAPPCRRATRT